MKNKKKNNFDWILKVTLLAFIISIIMSLVSEIFLKNVGVVIAILITLIFVGLGILFDIIGVSVTAGNIKIFNSMSSKKVRGANIAVKLIQNANKVSSVCCDVVGDVCGVASGSAGVVIAGILVNTYHFNTLLVSVLTTAVIAMLTIGGKAIGKGLAIRESTRIIHFVSKVISIFKR